MRKVVTQAELKQWIAEQLRQEDACAEVGEVDLQVNKVKVQSPDDCNWTPGNLRNMGDWSIDCIRHLYKVLDSAKGRFNVS